MTATKQQADFDTVRDIGLAMPEVEAHASARGPSLKLRGRLLACPAVHRSAEPDSLMIRIGLSDRARLIAENADLCYVTDHYEKHPAMLVRLSRARRETLEQLLGLAWQFVFEKSVERDRR